MDASEERFWNLVAKAAEDECWLWQGYKLPYGYGQVRWRKRTRLAHRVAYEIVHGEVPENLVVCHTCDVPACCNPAHLFVGTLSDNQKDSIKKGRYDRRTLLSDEDVRIIRIRYANGEASFTTLAREYKVSVPSIYQIIHHKSWKNHGLINQEAKNGSK